MLDKEEETRVGEEVPCIRAGNEDVALGDDLREVSAALDKGCVVEEQGSSSGEEEDDDREAEKGEENHIEDDDDDDDGESQGEGDEVQLGYAEPVETPRGIMMFRCADWHQWDGGKVGGKPIWLDPYKLPSLEALACPSCQDPMAFILQIYCPLDEPEAAFHRALYIFCCRKPTCEALGRAKAFRCQLRRDNPYYAYEPKEHHDGGNGSGGEGKATTSSNKKNNKKSNKTALGPEEWGVKLCALCGCRADKLCAGCKDMIYCSRAHQREHWKAGHKLQCKGAVTATTTTTTTTTSSSESTGAKALTPVKSVFPEYDIVIEDEDPAPRTAEEKKREEDALLAKYKTVYSQEPDEDLRVKQSDLNKATGGACAVKDSVTMAFLTRVAQNPDQILRYARWGAGGPLWVSTESIPKSSDIPPCPRCGAPRQFEFQVMPQLLHYLKVDAKTSLKPFAGPQGLKQDGVLDWGTLVVYTCTQSCGGGGHSMDEPSYVEEFVWRQEPLT